VIVLAYPGAFAIWRDNGDDLQGNLERLLHELEFMHKAESSEKPQQNNKRERFGIASRSRGHYDVDEMINLSPSELGEDHESPEQTDSPSHITSS
jgi:hypothetical protein